MKPGELTRAMIEAARSVAKDSGVRAVFLNADLVSDPAQLKGVFGETEVVFFPRKRHRPPRLQGVAQRIIHLPPEDLNRVAQIN
jgi:hypothetical protein